MNKYYLVEHTNDGDVTVYPKEFPTWAAMLKSKYISELARAVDQDKLRGYGYLIVRPAPMLPMLGGFIGDNMGDPGQMKFDVKLSATAYVTASVSVEADSKEAAEEKAKALARSGDVVWQYAGVKNEGPDTDPYEVMEA